MMKKLTICFIGILFLTCLSFSSCAQKNFDNALLWKISGNGLTTPSYILGTHHLIGIDFLDSISGFDTVFEGVEQVIGEVVASPEEMAVLQMKIGNAAKFAAGDSYSKLLSPEDYRRLDNGLSNVFNAGISNFENFTPGFVSILFAQVIYSKIDPVFNPLTHEAIDVYLQRIATEKGKPVLGLETADEQIAALFESESLKKQAEDLICALENMEWGKETLINLNSFYKERALSKIYDLSFHNENDPCPPSLRKMNALNRARNQKWLKKLPGMMETKPSLIAVGTLHLTGEDGLLNQLDKMGYILEAID